MDYADIYNLRQSGGILRNRVIVAIGSYAVYLTGQTPTADQQAFIDRVLPGTNAEIEADFIMWRVCFDAAVQASPDGITDLQLDSVVQTALATLGRVKAV